MLPLLRDGVHPNDQDAAKSVGSGYVSGQLFQHEPH